MPSTRGLVVEKDPRDREQVVGLPVVDRHPVRVELGRAVRRARVEGGALVLRRRGRAEHLRGRRLVVAAVDPGRADRLEQPQGAGAVGRRGVLRHLEGDLDVALRAEVVDLVGLDGVDQVDQAHAVGQVAVVQVQVGAVDVVDPAAVDRRGAPDQAVDLVALPQQQLGEVRAVLARDPGDEGALGHRWLRPRVRRTRDYRAPAGRRDRSGCCPVGGHLRMRDDYPLVETIAGCPSRPPPTLEECSSRPC